MILSTYGCIKIIKKLYLYMKEWDLTFVEVLIPDIIWVLRKSVIKKKYIGDQALSLKISKYMLFNSAKCYPSKVVVAL